MAALRLQRPVALRTKAADHALERLLDENRDGMVSVIRVPGQCVVRLLRRHDLPRSRECVVTWVPAAAHECTFIGSVSIVNRGSGRSPLLLLEGADARLSDLQAEALGRAVLEHIAAELSEHGHRFMRNTAPMLHAASPKRARMGATMRAFSPKTSA